MLVRGFRIDESVDSVGIRCITVKDAGDLSPGGFDAAATFESGQCFRWNGTGEGRYSGIAFGKSVSVSSPGRRDILIENAVPEDFYDIWYDYLDLGTDYNMIAKASSGDDFMRRAITFAGGARVLKQEFNETLFSYILSSQNNIPRIKGLVKDLCIRHGEIIPYSEGDTEGRFGGHAFPEVSVLARDFCTEKKYTDMDQTACRKCSAVDLCGSQFAGYRCPYIALTAAMLEEKNYIPDPVRLADTDQDSARKDLCILPGVGEKVADCVLLYSGIRHDVCPIDTWVEKTIRRVYLNDNATKKDIRSFTQSYFGEYAGYAQLWFFYYARSSGLR